MKNKNNIKSDMVLVDQFILDLCFEGRVNRPRLTRQSQIMAMYDCSAQKAAKLCRELAEARYGLFINKGNSERNLFRWTRNPLRAAQQLRNREGVV